MSCQTSPDASHKGFLERFYPIDQETPSRVLAGAGYGVALNVMQRVVNATVPQASSLETQYSAEKRMLSEKGRFSLGKLPLRSLVKATVLAPIFEECLFRGVYAEKQERRRSYFIGDDSNSFQKIKDYAENSALFTAAHYDFKSCFKTFSRRTPMIFASGMALSYIADKSGTLFEATVAHAVSNALTLFALRGKFK